MIRIAQLVKNYGNITALDSVDLTIEEGECVVLIGPSGCGKSTLLRSINRMIQPDSGSVYVDEQDILNYPPETLRRKIGYCIQNVGLFPHYTVYENIAVVPKMLKWSKAKIEERVDFLMDLTGLPKEYKTKKPHELSGGEAQRVGVCRALAADPDILLMDEPFGAVDPMTRVKIQTAFKNIQKELKKTVVFVTHDVEEAVLLADKIAVMQNGKILGYDTPSNFALHMEEEFVRSFLGVDYPVKLLKRHNIDDLLDQESDSKLTLNELLAGMLESPDGSVTIQNANGSKQTFHFEDLTHYLHKDDQV